MTTATKWAGTAAVCALLAGGLGGWALLESARRESDSGHASAPLTQSTAPAADTRLGAEPLGAERSTRRTVVAPAGEASSGSPTRASGRVLFPQGYVPGVVALYSLDAGGAPSGDPEAYGPWKEDGEFRLESAHAGPHVVCALATSESSPRTSPLRPATRACSLVLGGETVLAPIELLRGEAVAGRAIWASGKPVHPGQIAVSLANGGGDLQSSLAGMELAWTNGAFELAETGAALTPDGTFHVAGLARRAYTVHPHHAVSAADPVPMTRVGSEPAPVEVLAPATGIELVLGEEPIRLRVFGRGAPLPCSVAVVKDESTWAMHTNEDGELDLVPATDARTEVEFSQPEYLPHRLVFEPYEWTPGAVIDVHLEPGPPPASLVVELTPDAAERLGDRPVDLYLFALDEEEGRAAARAWTGAPLTAGEHPGGAWISPGTDMHREIRREGDELHVPDLRAGRYEVHAYPRYLRRDGLGPPWLETSFEIELGSGERARATLDPQLGGRLVVHLRGELAVGTATFRLEDRSGRDLDVRYARFDFETGARRIASQPTAGSNHVFRPLPAGTYRLRIRVDESERLDRWIEIGVDRVREISLDLSAI